MARTLQVEKELFEINKRFKEAFETLAVKNGIARKKLSEEIGYKTTRQLYHIFDGNSLVPLVAIYYMSKKYHVSLEWLLHGIGEMFKSNESSIEEYESLINKLTIELRRTRANLLIMTNMEKMKSEMNRNLLLSEDERDQMESVIIDDLVREKNELDDAELDNLSDIDK